MVAGFAQSVLSALPLFGSPELASRCSSFKLPDVPELANATLRAATYHEAGSHIQLASALGAVDAADLPSFCRESSLLLPRSLC